MNVEIVSIWPGASFGLPTVIASVPSDIARPESDANYAVGFGKPPKTTRWRKGVSGNPSGKRKPREDERDWTFYDVMADELKREASVTKDGRTIKLSKERILAQASVNRAVKGDNQAARFVVETAAKAKRRQIKQEIVEDAEASRAKDREAVAQFLASFTRQKPSEES
jgi:hypothetical protein